MFPKFSFERLARLIWRPRPKRRGLRFFAGAIGTVVLLAIAACVSEQSPTAARPTPASLSESSSPADAAASKADQAARKARHDELMRERDSVRAVFKQLKDDNRDNLRAAQADWNAFKHAFENERKLNKNASVELLRCQPQDFAGDAEVIGPDGGALHVGPHSLVVPKGALDQEYLLVGTAPTSSLVQVQFGPHGLQFQVPAALTLSYEQCMVPDKYTYRIVYVQENRILEFPPSSDDKTLKSVTAPIGHFSGYMIAY